MSDTPVLLTEAAAGDLGDIIDYVNRNSGAGPAGRLLNRIESRLVSLARFPARGHYVPELRDLGIREYREVRFKPYRMIYRAMDSRVIVYCIWDGRRDLRDLLLRRLTGV